MLDFLTLVFGSKTEIGLLKLQAIGFKRVEPTFIDQIGTIFIFYNDDGIENLEFIKTFYPDTLRSKVSIIYRDNVTRQHERTNWRNQQYFKLFISKFIQSEYYIVLDAKNHFIRDVNINDFFSDGKPKLYQRNPGKMISFYKNCVKI